ncbi:MAG: hypothetical protein PUP92_31305 [Rhizonema sp. PD38]|nr:hypothetical protein [Rhizonema sp. PD38]
MSVLLLAYIITQSDHRLSPVEPWVETQTFIIGLNVGFQLNIRPSV